MLKKFIHKQHVLNRMRHSYFGSKFEDYVFHLSQLGYRPETIKTYCQCVEHFGRWLGIQKIAITSICNTTINNFINKHLLKCKCQTPRTKEIKSIRAAINQLLKIINRDNKAYCSIDILNSFDAYLSDVCGLSENTRIYRRRYVFAFLNYVKVFSLSQVNRISTKHIINFIKKVTCHYKSKSMRSISTSLRSFFKYLSFEGHDVKKIISAIPRVPNWKLSSIPSFLNNSQIKKFISIFDRTTASGKRDYAIARCFIDLGLRCYEVANIKLKDINWHEGILKIPRGKAKQEDQLPLPKSLGKAISEYLIHGRPKSNSEFVFVFHRAPFGEAAQVTTVRGVIRRAFKKSGFNPVPGTHILRHSFATRLLVSGTSLKDIADMLRHKCIDTTMLYTKIDLPHLHCVAMPWFGRKS